MLSGVKLKVLPGRGRWQGAELVEVGPLEPAAEPSDEGGVPLEQGLEGSGQDDGGVGGEEEGMVEGEEGTDHVQGCPLHEHIVVQQCRAGGKGLDMREG